MAAAVTVAVSARSDEGKHLPLLDESGRELIPGGYVVLEDIPYTADDYRRMVRMGANFQVIRMPIWTVGAWPGRQPDEKALAHFDELVRLGKDAGMKTVFKLVFYGVRPFGDQQWDMVWNNRDGVQDKIMEGWTLIWKRYKDEPSVFGYDLINEPARGLSKDYERIQREQLLPLLRRLADAMRQISPGKWVLYQPLLRKPGEQTTKHRDPVVAVDEPFARDRVIYAPHLYQMDMSVIPMMLDNLQRQAALSRAPLLLGEWGSPTRAATDANVTEQDRFTKVYQFTANQMDHRGIGGIKPWFCGTRRMIPLEGGKAPVTWAIFSDSSPAGRNERKYLIDVLARPRPLVVAGRVEDYGNDFSTLTFKMTLRTDPALGRSEIFVPAERHYPGGFRVEFGAGLTLDRHPGGTTLRVTQARDAADKEQAKSIRWDEDQQRLIVARWAGQARPLTITIQPLAQR